jgi:hypothetical protein
MNSDFTDVLHLVCVLFAVVIAYIIAGIAEGVLVNGEKFDTKKLFNGILKAATACGSLIVISYACTIVDLSNLGFYPKTAITSGIVVYAGKLIAKSMELLGLESLLSKTAKKKLDNIKVAAKEVEETEEPVVEKEETDAVG